MRINDMMTRTLLLATASLIALSLMATGAQAANVPKDDRAKALSAPRGGMQAEKIPTTPVESFTAAQKTHVEEVERYLTGITTILADFVQVAPDGGLVSGKFYLKRPGKMRWQYDPPTPILMIADGKHLIFYDYELDQTSPIPLEDTLAGFLARQTIAFGTDVVITDIQDAPGSLRLSMVQKAKPKDGSLTLEFATNPLQLRNMLVFDAAGQQTTVALNNARYDTPLDDKLFVFESQKFKPRIGKPKSPVSGLER